MEIYYVNGNGEKLDFMKWPYLIQSHDLFDYGWSYATKSGEVLQYTKDVTEKTITLNISADTKETYYNAINHFYDVVERDVIENVPGKLYVGEQYLMCNIIASKKLDWSKGVEYLKNTVAVIPRYPFWRTEKMFVFPPDKSSNIQSVPIKTGDIYKNQVTEDVLPSTDENTIHPLFDLPFDFIKICGRRILENTSFVACDFIMTIYGFVDNPSILIGGHLYAVVATIYEGEQLIINSADHTVKKIGRLGDITNLYNAREKQYSVFKKIPPGVQTISWSGNYGIDIQLIYERSEPMWSLFSAMRRV